MDTNDSSSRKDTPTQANKDKIVQESGAERKCGLETMLWWVKKTQYLRQFFFFLNIWTFRIHITKQLEVEAEEAIPALDTDAEQSKAQRRKNKRVRKDSASLAEEMTEKVKEVEFVVDAVPLIKSNEVLMVEVDNVMHEEFQVTEEVKVLTCITSLL